MVMKAGANNHDKVRVRKFHAEGKTLEQIAALVSLRMPHVKAIVKQIDDGTLKIGGVAKTSYGHGDKDGKEPEIEQLAAVKMVDDAKDTEIAELQAKLVEANKEPEAEAEDVPVEETAAEASEEEEPVAKPRRRRRAAAK